MMKTTQNQKLSEKNVLLTKHLNKLKEKEKAVSLHGVNKLYKDGLFMYITLLLFLLYVCVYA